MFSRAGVLHRVFTARTARCGFALLLAALLVAGAYGLASAPQAANQTGTQAPRAAPAPPPVTPATAEFLRAADEVLEEVSRLLALPVKSPLKRSIRTREEIREYILREMREEKEPWKRYADQKTLEKFGLIPRDFPLDEFLVDLLTEQIAGLYDPKGREFFIADWINPGEQRMVMAHELTHALHDQHYSVETWLKAPKPDDDAMLARHAVLEGAATAAMIDYLLRGQNMSVANLPDLEQLIRGQMLGDLEHNPKLAKAPGYLRDALVFPYLAGTTFTQHVLRTGGGWAGFAKVFENPPISSQQVMYPEMYSAGVVPQPVTLPDLGRALPAGWKKLDENLAGEFGTHAVLKQFLGQERAERLSRAWAGDRYAIFEHARTKQLLLVFRLRLASAEDSARLFGGYSEALELKYTQRAGLFRRPNYFQFTSEEGGVFFRCVAEECVSVEGVDRASYDRITRALGWMPAPRPPVRQPVKSVAGFLPVAPETNLPAEP